MLPSSGGFQYQNNASSSYAAFSVQKAFDANSGTLWETDAYLYSNGQFDEQNNCSYASSLKTSSYEYPMFDQLVENYGEWAEIKFSTPIRISGYAITVSGLRGSPANWKLMVAYPEVYGSNWYTIHKVENENQWNSANDGTIYFEIPEQYRSVYVTVFRLVFSKTNDLGFVRIGEISFNGKSQNDSTSFFITLFQSYTL